MSHFGTPHIRKFGGEIWYVSKSGSDTNSGGHPDDAFLTVGAALTACASGDGINVKAGVYDEASLDLGSGSSKDGVELWCEIGTRISNSGGGGGTCLVISGDTCLVSGLVVQEAGQIGFDINGAGTFLTDCISTDNTVAYDIDGVRCTFVRCKDQGATVTGFDIASMENTLYLCNTIADGGTSRGYYLSNAAADRNMLYQCVSAGNTVAGFEAVAATNNNVFAYCTSGGGDGARVDAGVHNTWPNFAFENKIHKIQTFAGGGGGSTELFRVYGIVQIKFIYGIVETNLNADVDNISLDVFPDGGALVALTTSVDSASAIAGSMFVKKSDAGNPLVLHSGAVPFISEDDTKQKPFTETIIGEQGDGTDTHIRSTYSGVATTGAIDWHIEWEPFSDDGFVAIA